MRAKTAYKKQFIFYWRRVGYSAKKWNEKQELLLPSQ